MKPEEATVGRRVIAATAWCGVLVGTEGVIVDDYGSGVTVAWDRAGNPLPKLPPAQIAAMAAVDPECPLRDGFDKETELKYLIPVDAGHL